MFTFSFGSAFGANFTLDKTLAQAQFGVAWKALTDRDSADITVSETINKGTDKEETSTYKISLSVLEANKAAILDAVYELDKTKENSSYVCTYDTLVEAVNSDSDLYMALVESQYAADKEEALAILSGLDTSSYSTETMTVKTDDKYMTYVEAVKYYISLAEDAINEATFTSDSKVKDYAAAKTTIDAQFNAYANEDGTAENGISTTAIAQEKGYEAGAKYVGLDVYEVNEEFLAGSDRLATFKTTAVNADKATDSAQREALKAAAKSAYAQHIAVHTKAEEIVDADKALEAVIYTIDNVDNRADAITFDSLVDNGAIKATFLTNYKNAADFETFANRYAAEKDATGTLVRDAKDVADIVKAAKLAAYQGTTAWTQGAIYKDSKTYEEAVKALSVSGDAAELEYAIKHYEALADKYVADAKDDDTYYAKELAEVEALVAEFKTKVEALTDVDKVADLYKDYFNTNGKKVKAVEAKDVAVTGTLIEDGAKATGDVADLYKTAVTYRDLFNESIKGTDNDYTSDANTLLAAVKKLVGDAGARTAKDIAALGTQIPDLVKALPTNAAVNAAKDAADDAVKAAKYSDQASMDAALKAIDDYEDLTLVDYDRTAINAKVKSMAYAYNNTLNNEYTNASKTDKAALKAIQDKIDAFVDTYETNARSKEIENVFGALSTNIERNLANIKADDAKAVADKINALPINLTAADKATVEAARKAYNDFVAEYTDYEDAQSAEAYLKAHGVDASALASAEAVLGLNAVSPAELVKGLKITARSTAKKGSITVKWTVKGEADIDGYEIWKSTKANKGYKKAFTTTKKTYKNTKGLKKGTRYYYKVRAYKVIDGVKVTSDWSNKANRKAK